MCCGDIDWRKPVPEIVQNSKRSCTDIQCWLFLLCLTAIEIYLIVYSSEEGAEPDSIRYGFDYEGRWCNENHPNGSLNAWVNVEKSVNFRICVKSCDQTSDGSDDRFVELYESTKLGNAYCVPDDYSSLDLTFFDEFDAFDEQFQRGMNDISTAKYMLIAAALISVFLAFGYLKVIEYVGAFFIWATVVAVYIGGIIAAWLLIAEAIENFESEESEDTAAIQLSIGIGVIVFLLLLTCLLIWLRNRIELALVMLDQAGDAIHDMKSVLLFPALMFFPVGLYLVFWTAIALCIYSVKVQESRSMPEWLLESRSSINDLNYDNYYYYEWDEGLRSVMSFHFICLLYSIQLIVYFGYMVMAGAFADWYFSEWAAGSQDKKRRGTRRAELSEWPVMEAFYRVVRYHIGSLAFGALVITCVRILRAWITYANRLVQQNAGNSCGTFARVVCCCVLCIDRCCSTLLERASRDGFIFTSIYGTSFCFSSYQAIRLVMNNVARVTMVQGISAYMEFVGRYGIPLLVTGLSVIVFESVEYYQENLNGYVYPAIMVFLVSYVTSSLFMEVFEVALDTIFLCFLVDEHVNMPPRFASDKLLEHASQYGGMITTKTDDPNTGGRANTR